MVDTLLIPIKILVDALNGFLWGDLIIFNIRGTKIGLSLLVVILLSAGLYFTIGTRFLPFRMFPEMLRVVLERKKSGNKETISGLQALLIATASRVGMGNLAGVVAAITFGGPGSIFWMWVVALVGSASAFVETTLAQLYKEKDPVYGGYRGGPAYFMKRITLVTETRIDDIFPEGYGKNTYISIDNKKQYTKGSNFKLLGVLFALSGLLCWAGISQVVANSVTQSFANAFSIKPLYTTIILVIFAGIVIFVKSGIINVITKLVPVMGVLYIIVTLFIIFKNINSIPSMLSGIFGQALGFKQAVAGGFGAVVMNGVKRGLFSNEAGSGSAPCADAAADVEHPVKQGLIQSLGVFIDTLLICSCSAFIILLAPKEVINGLQGMDLLQAALNYQLGEVGVIFIALILFLFSFSTFLGITFYARSNVAFVFGDSMKAQKIYQLFLLCMLFVGGLAQYVFVWELADLGVGLMTIFNIMAIIPLFGQVLHSLTDYETNWMKKK